MDKNNLPESYTKCPCFIKVVMQEGENEMKKYLSNKTLKWLYNEVYGKILPQETEIETLKWFKSKRESTIK